MVSMAWSTIWTDEKIFDVELTGSGSYSWSHVLPGGTFSVPPDTINSASLDITARRATNADDFVYLSLEADMLLGTLLQGEGNSQEATFFDLASRGVFYLGSTWSAGDTLDFILDFQQPSGANNTLTLESSLFTLDYTSGFVGEERVENAAAPVPEPSTIILLGGGLAGLAFVVRRRKKE